MKELKNYKSNNPCECCGFYEENAVCFHHVKSRKSGGSDNPFNLISVCQPCHNMFHNKGTVYMSLKYSSVQKWLIKNNWELDYHANKWRHNG